MLKGQVFSRQLFENQIFALFINTFLNGNNGVASNYANEMALSYSGSDVTINSGAVCIQGRFLNEDTSTTLSAGTDAMYCKLVIEIDLDKQNTESDFQQGYYKIVSSASGYPNLTQTNVVKNNAGVYQYELARFRTTSNGITNFQDKRTFLDFNSIYDEIRQHIQNIDDGSLWVQKAGDTMTGGLIITTNTLTTFSHKRNINDSEFETKVGTGKNVNDGEASLLLEDANDNIIGRLDVRADGKIYNGITNDKIVETSELTRHVSQNDTQFAAIINRLIALENKDSEIENSLTNHVRQNDSQFSAIISRLNALENTDLEIRNDLTSHISQNDTEFAEIERRLTALENRNT